MVSVEALLAVIGLVIVTGFVGGFLFEKLRIPDVLLLLGVGVLLGKWFGPETQALAAAFAPYFGAIAIIMILFEGGLTLEAGEIAGQLKNAFLLALLTFVISMGWVAYAAIGWMGLGVMHSLMLGAIIGCTSSAIIIPTVQRSRAPESIKALAAMESVFSDTIAIVAMVALVNIEIGLEVSATTPVRQLLVPVGIALAVAFPVGLLWLNILEWTKARPLSYLWTFALLVLLYAGVHWLHGSGALAVFFLALLISNSEHLPKWLVLGKWIHSDPAVVEALAHETVKWFHTELTFLIRSFFFVYIGLLFRTEYIQGIAFWLMVGFTAVLLTSRSVSIWMVQRKREPLPRPLLWAFLPRGLTSAVLAIIPASRGIEGSDMFLSLTVPVIISTNIIMTIGVMFWEWRHGRHMPASKEPSQTGRAPTPGPVPQVQPPPSA